MNDAELWVGFLVALGYYVVFPGVIAIVAALVVPVAADWWEAWLLNAIHFCRRLKE